MAATPLFLVTNTGLAVASQATPTGPYIHITSFKVGSAYGYDPQRTDPDINGTLLYEGVPSAYQYVGDNTINIICKLPPDAGPFDFGEVAVYLDGGVMFAKAVFDTPQSKFSSLGTNVLSTYTFNVLLKLQQSVSVFKIETGGVTPAVWEVDKWSDVYPPGVSANPDIPLTLVRELDTLGNSSLLQNSSDAKWTVGTNYNLLTQLTVTDSTTSWVECSPTGQAGHVNFTDTMLSAVSRKYVVETSDHFFRSVATVTKNGSNYHFAFNPDPLSSPPAIGSVVTIYANKSDGKLFYSQIQDPPSIPLATVGTPGLAYGSSGLYMPSPGVIQAYGLLHGPSTNTGRQLTASDSLNANLASGVYTVTAGFGYPAAMPVPWDGQVFVTNPGVSSNTSIIQTYYPTGSGGGSPDGTNGYPIFWRSYNATNGVWTNWSPLSAGGRGASVMAYSKSSSTPITLTTGVWNVAAWAYTHQNTYPANQLYINGTLVDYTNDHGDPEGTGFTPMYGKLQLGISGSTTITANAVWPDTTGDSSILVIALPA